MKCIICGVVEVKGAACDDCYRIERAAVIAVEDARYVGGPKYNATSWAHVPAEEHLLHAIEHLRLVGLGDRSEDHLSHAICRLAMAKAILSE